SASSWPANRPSATTERRGPYPFVQPLLEANSMPLADTRPLCRIAVLISGRGSNLQSIIDAIASRRLAATMAVVVSNRADAAGLQRARDAGIEALHLSPRDHAERDAYDRAIAGALQTRGV